ncbi:MAG: hypothetical protein K2J72_04915 [Oscillospiraceae bacterium]|nr:hypothetical protein [Oscillospiraceae bacterium]
MGTKKIFACLLVSVMVATLFGCGKAGETVPEETAVPETTAAASSEEELDTLAADMPEIVFVMSHHYDDTNILGFYITNTGEMKIYDFRNIAPDEIYDIPDVYDRLEEAVCSRIEPAIYDPVFYEEQVLTDDKLCAVSETELKEKYKMLLKINENSSHIEYESLADEIQGYYNGYGIRYNENKETEIVLLYKGGDYIYERDDEYSSELFHWLRFEKGPKLPRYIPW